jgi:hypothetical protein
MNKKVCLLAGAAWLLAANQIWVHATTPGWWVARGVTSGTAQDDYALANQGQVKNIATAAMSEMDAVLSGTGGAGAAIHALVDAWQTPGPETDDYARVNLGQLKNVAKLVYDRFAEVAIPGTTAPAYHYPWTEASVDDEDFSLLNVGQLKRVFDFDLANPDRDGDGLNDLVELIFTGTDPWNADSNGNGVPDGEEDADGDGINNISELAFGLNPAVNNSAQADAGAVFTYDRLNRVRSDKERSSQQQNVTVDAEGNVTGIN